MVLLPCAGALLFGLLAYAIPHETTGRAFANVAAEGIFGLVVPIAALVIGDAVLGAEMRSGTFQFTWLSPAPTWQIVLGRWLGGSIVALVTIAPSCALAAVVAGDSRQRGRGVRRRRGRQRCVRRDLHRHRMPHPADRGVVTRVRLPASSACSAPRSPGIAQLSPTWESRAIFVGFIHDAPSRLVRKGIPQGGGAVVRLLIVTVVALAIANWRMRHLRMSGASD